MQAPFGLRISTPAKYPLSECPKIVQKRPVLLSPIPYPVTTLTGEGKAAILARRGLAVSSSPRAFCATRNHDWATARKTDGQASQPGDGGRGRRGIPGGRATFNVCGARRAAHRSDAADSHACARRCAGAVWVSLFA